jgi:hypothetical protein
MSWTTSDLAVIEAAIASGNLSVRFADRSVQRFTMEELLKARDVIKQSIALAGNETSRSTLASFSKD